MGIKENFNQAIRELTGVGKDKNNGKTTPTDELRKAVEDGSPSAQPITLDAVTDESVEVSTYKPVKSEKPQPFTSPTPPPPPQTAATTPVSPDTDTTPAAEEFLSGKASAPVSIFGQQPRQATPQTFAKEVSSQPAASQPATAPTPQPQPFQQPTPVQPTQTLVSPVQVVQPVQPPTPPPAPQTLASQPFQQPMPMQTMQSMSSSSSSTYGGGGGNQFNQFNQFNSPPPQNRNAVPVSRSGGGQDDGELTIISRNTMVDGNIRSFADMSIDGDIKGDVETTKNVDLNGKIVGNITCNNAMMHTSQVQGNIRMKGNVSMKRDTLLIGDLMSTYAEVNGKIKGNLDVVGKADFRGDAVVFGDISASTITVEDGAIIQGYVSTTFLNKDESKNLFPDSIIISETGSRL